ncbi:MAG: NUDIX hydrolase [Erysipelotrichaceae bacterium]|nr:NUDIX hydrolase [Erysipelotrichaceae bacterium]MDY6034349.1 NUDIX hydrolase [Bulleidia sp.]
MKYNHIVSVSSLVVNQENKVLLVKHPIRGWHCPSGFVNSHESIQEAMKRIVQEEVGIDVRLVDLVGVNKDVTFANVNIDFISRYDGDCDCVEGNHQEVGWFSKDEVMRMVKEGYVHETVQNMLFYRGQVACWDFKKSPFEMIVKDIYPKH